MVRLWVSTLALSALAAPVYAEPTLTEFRELHRTDEPVALAYASGVVAGLTWANGLLESEDQPALFCLPERLALAPEQVIDMVEQQRETDAALTDKHIFGMIALIALRETFPCSPPPIASAAKRPAN